MCSKAEPLSCRGAREQREKKLGSHNRSECTRVHTHLQGATDLPLGSTSESFCTSHWQQEPATRVSWDDICSSGVWGLSLTLPSCFQGCVWKSSGWPRPQTSPSSSHSTVLPCTCCRRNRSFMVGSGVPEHSGPCKQNDRFKSSYSTLVEGTHTFWNCS